MNKKTLLITVLVLVAVLGVAAALYPKLSEGMQTQQLATVATEQEVTTEATETTEPAQATEDVPPQTSVPTPVFAPDFTVLDWDGNEVQFSDYIGKPIVLNFWAYWCGPCQMEMPEFNAKWEELGGEVTFLMVHEGSGTEEGKAKVTDGGYTFPVVFDEGGVAGMLYGINAYPTSFFINAEGHLKAYYMGAMDSGMLQRGIDLIYTPEE